MDVTIGIVQSEYDPLDTDKLMEDIDKVKKADIICFPECFAAGRSLEETAWYLQRICKDSEKILDTIKNATEKCVIFPLLEREEQKLYNTTYVFKNKEIIGKYIKIHVYPWGEFFFSAGSEHPVFDIGGFTIGVMTCFDAAFPETARVLSLKGAKIIIVSSSWPEEAKYLWEIRLCARAQDNQVFVVAANRCGKIGTEVYLGKSMVVNPRGEIIAQCGNMEQVMLVNIDLNQIEEERNREPIYYGFDKTLYEHLL
ncbi:MAG: carbon-nitrogen hydrolase family protein [Methanosarcinales archaeon]